MPTCGGGRRGNAQNMKLYDLGSIGVLVVDDNRFMRTIVFNTLQGLGVKRIEQANGVDDALERLREGSYDLVISDWDMGEKSGIDLIKTMRASKLTRMIPIVMLTANTTRKTVFSARDAGMTEFLAKPISAQSLYSRIVEVIERPRQYVKTKTYFGPDRRRRSDPNFKGPERRKAAGAKK